MQIHKPDKRGTLVGIPVVERQRGTIDRAATPGLYPVHLISLHRMPGKRATNLKLRSNLRYYYSIQLEEAAHHVVLSRFSL